MWCYILLLLAIAFSTSFAYPTAEEYDNNGVNRVFVLVPVPDLERFTSEEETYPKDIYNIKRAVPFNGGMYGKRSGGIVRPFSGGMYGKRSVQIGDKPQIHTAQRRAMVPFSGGMYGR